MDQLWRRIRGGLGMGLTWAIVWGLVGGVMEALANVIPALNFIDMWPQTLAIPGFVGGVAFSVILAIAGRHKELHQLSFAKFVAWGGSAGLLLGLAVVRFLAGRFVLDPTALLVMGTTTLLSAGSASSILALARFAKGGNGIGSGSDPSRLGPG